MESKTAHETKFSLLSDKAIVKEIENGNVVIHPFAMDNLSTSSYDVTLGEYYFREKTPDFNYVECPKEAHGPIYNPYSMTDTFRVWGKEPEKAKTRKEMVRSDDRYSDVFPLEGIRADERVIFIQPGETILAHTQEFIGGKNSVTTMMKARSSMGRNFIEVCKCAGWGDIGYVNRWTMEITNNSRFYTIPLVVGRRIAQIVFFQTDGTLQNRSYSSAQGKYQTSEELQTIMTKWSPLSCLPRLFDDRENQTIKTPETKNIS